MNNKLKMIQKQIRFKVDFVSITLIQVVGSNVVTMQVENGDQFVEIDLDPNDLEDIAEMFEQMATE